MLLYLSSWLFFSTAAAGESLKASSAEEFSLRLICVMALHHHTTSVAPLPKKIFTSNRIPRSSNNKSQSLRCSVPHPSIFLVGPPPTCPGLSILKSQCDYQSDPSRTATSYFLDWLVGSGANTFPAFYASRLAPLLLGCQLCILILWGFWSICSET